MNKNNHIETKVEQQWPIHLATAFPILSLLLVYGKSAVQNWNVTSKTRQHRTDVADN